MWRKGWRKQVWEQLDQKWDMIIIGGGITGAGIFKLATQLGFKALLIEKHDFAYGTSSRSSKLVHGGLRYLNNFQFKVCYESVQERERLIKSNPYLVSPLAFILPIYQRYNNSTWKFELALSIYDLFAKRRMHGKYNRQEIENRFPLLNKIDLTNVLYYYDAVVDDARLVLCTLRDGIKSGGLAINYVSAEKLIFDKNNKVIGILIKNQEHKENERTKEIFGSAIINATGPWSDNLRMNFTNSKIIRKLRGSHLIFAKEKLPIEKAYLFIHPVDGRALFAIPWENITIIGTTDLDHPAEYEKNKPEPFITQGEIDYLLTAVNTIFPKLDLSEKDILSTFSGLRPIVCSRSVDPSKASRMHKILFENGLYTIAGGKLTTYHRMAMDLLKQIIHKNPISIKEKEQQIASIPNLKLSDNLNISEEVFLRLSGRLGNTLPEMLERSNPEEFTKIGKSMITWAELRWAVREEGVIHLDDLLLRRTRIGLLCKNGAEKFQKRIQSIVQEELSWGKNEWKTEWEKYKLLWSQCYYLPD